MEDIIILGVDIHALETIDMIHRTGKYNFIGMIRDSADGPSDYLGYPVLGGPDALSGYPGALRVPMHGWKAREDRRNWVNVIADSSFISATAVLGSGCIIYPNCFIGANARLGDGVFMLSGSVINHDCVIEDHVTVTTGVTLAGSVRVKTGAYLGQACMVRQLLTVGENVMVGMGAVVTRDIADNVTVIGCPARIWSKPEKCSGGIT